MAAQTFLILLVCSVLLAALIVAARFVVCLVRAIRSRRYWWAVLATAGILLILAALGAVIVAWFIYAVAHIGKNASTDLKVLLSTAPPFFLFSVFSWWAAGRLAARLNDRSPRQGSDRYQADTAA